MISAAVIRSRRARALRSGGSRRRRGFTLIEVLLVLAILVILAGLSVVAIANVSGSANIKAAKAKISGIQQLVDLYRLDVGSYPTEQAGLQALIAPPADLSNPRKWKGPYLQEATVPKDPWGNPYGYKRTGDRSYLIYSWGENQNDENGGGDDISNLTEI